MSWASQKRATEPPGEDCEREYTLLVPAIDADGNGAIDADELIEVLQGDPLAQDMTFDVFFV